MTSFFSNKALMYSLLVIVVVVAGFFLLNNTSYNLLGFAGVPAYSSTTLGEHVVLELTAFPLGMTVDIYSPEEKDFFVHKIVHYAKDDWASTELQTLQPELQVGSWNDTWIRGAAQVTIESLPEGEYYVVAYVCQLYSLADFDDTPLTAAQRTTIEEFFTDQTSQYLCGLTEITSQGLNYNNWLLAQVSVPALEDDDPFGDGQPPLPQLPGQNTTGDDPELMAGVDINALPDDTSLDANGWPKYLNVSEECGPADPQRNYIHYNYQTTRALGAPAGWRDDGPLQLRALFEEIHDYRYGVQRRPFLTDLDTIAAPFITANVEGVLHSIKMEVAGPDVIGVPMKVSWSYCPGDFESNQIPAGMPDISGCAWNEDIRHLESAPYTIYRQDSAQREALNSRSTLGHCFLEPNTRYFMNIELRNDNSNHEIGACTKQYEDGVAGGTNPGFWQNYPTRTINGQQLPVCSFLLTPTGSPQPAAIPYAGPFLGQQDHYPINYRGPLVPNNVYQQRLVAAACKQIQDMTSTVVCHDPENILPPQNFTSQCVNGQERWTQGENEPAFSSYLCEHFINGSSVYAKPPMPDKRLNHQGFRRYEVPCAAHRDGHTRTVQCTGLSSYKVVEQCQFDNENARYDWTAIERSHLGRAAPGGIFDCRYTYEETNLPQQKDTCRLAGTEYEIGSQIKVSCPLIGRQHLCSSNSAVNPVLGECRFHQQWGNVYYESEILSCEQRADGSALPTFVLQEGYLNQVEPHILCEITELE